MDKDREWWIVPWVFYALSDIMELQEDYAKAQAYLETAYPIFQEHNRIIGLTEGIVRRGFIALAQGKYSEASSYFRDGLELSKDISFKRCIGSCIRGLAGTALGKGNLARSTRLFGAGEALIKITGSQYHSLAEKAINERNLMILRARLDEKTFLSVWQEGNNLSLEEAIAYAIEKVKGESGFEN